MDDKVEVDPPDVRIKKLCDRSNNFKIDFNTPAKRYYKSGEQMVRMAEMYLKEGNYEYAFFMYMKFIQLFIEKIRPHPDRKNVSPEDIAKIKQTLKQAIEKTEKLKMKLKENFTVEYNKYLEQKRKKEEQLLQRQTHEEEKCEKIHNTENTGGILKNTITKDVVKPVPYLPDDFLVYEIPETRSPVSPTYTDSLKPKPGVDRSTKPSTYNSYNSSLYGALKQITVPSKMLDLFLQLAQKNTSNNIETCGILAGKLRQNRIIITHLLIPKQYGSSDSCTTDNEEDLFYYQSKHDLITVGWIHTHPSQTAFLSSVDLHTHYSYQLMMSEAIAIVCAPRYSQTGFFRLTPNYGVDFIANCRQKGFHPHPSDPPLFEDADHCEIDESAPIEVIDLRR